MKPRLDSLCVVTASTNVERAEACLRSWVDRAAFQWPFLVVLNGIADVRFRFPFDLNRNVFCLYHQGYLGTVPAFAKGVQYALDHSEATVIACLHDDLLIEEDGWDQTVVTHFAAHPACGLAGFGGALGLGAADIYQTPYDPMQLARQDFYSNLRDAEQHGVRVLQSARVSVLDGFSQIGRREFWQSLHRAAQARGFSRNVLTGLAELGFVHHAYDAALGCLAKRMAWDVWYLPVACHHFGGRTAVLDQGYHEWAREQTESGDGDQEFWEAAHAIAYREFKDVLPLRI